MVHQLADQLPAVLPQVREGRPDVIDEEEDVADARGGDGPGAPNAGSPSTVASP